MYMEKCLNVWSESMQRLCMAAIFEIMCIEGWELGTTLMCMDQKKNKLCTIHKIGCYIVIRMSKLLLYIAWIKL